MPAQLRRRIVFLRIVPDAYDADEIKDQIKILEDFSTEKESAGVASIN
jgi:hypothetical protein